MPAAGLSVDSLMLALKTTFDPAAGSGAVGVYGVRLGDDRFRVEVADGRVDLARGAADDADATIETDTLTLTRLVFGGLSLAEAIRSGDASVVGDRRAVSRFLRLLVTPVPVGAG
jgi:alkyl sulfatase BDS1-like metallo-beta-lactamase superfamily hydrolase